MVVRINVNLLTNKKKKSSLHVVAKTPKKQTEDDSECTAGKIIYTWCWVKKMYSTGHLIRNREAGLGWISCLRMGSGVLH